MSLTGDSTILVPVDVSVPEPPDRSILELLRPVDLVVLGYYPVPKQTAPAHLKEDHEPEAAARLDARGLIGAITGRKTRPGFTVHTIIRIDSGDAV